jgi:hypothetical protein
MVSLALSSFRDLHKVIGSVGEHPDALRFFLVPSWLRTPFFCGDHISPAVEE